MSSLAEPYITPERYLELERKAERKSEYFNGHIFAMTGSSFIHNRIVKNLVVSLETQFGGGPCEAISNDLRVQVAETGLYTYPDVVVFCEDPRFADAHLDTLLNPTLLIEVLSSSTEAYDRGAKFAHYRRLESLREYLLVSQEKPCVERFVRRGEEWVLTETSGLEAILNLDSVGCRLALSEIYDRVTFPASAGLRSGRE